MNSKAKKIWVQILGWVAVVITVIGVWAWVSAAKNNALLYPTPVEVLAESWKMLGQKNTYKALLATFLRSIGAFVCSALVAIAFVTVSGLFPKTRKFVDAIVLPFRSVPTMSVILLAVIMFSDEIVPVFVAFLIAFPVMYSAFEREITRSRLPQVCAVYDAPKSKQFKYVIMPQIGSVAFSTVKDNLPLCVKVIIAGEALSFPKNGIGQEMYASKQAVETARLLALTILMLVVCLLLQILFGALEKKYGKTN